VASTGPNVGEIGLTLTEVLAAANEYPSLWKRPSALGLGKREEGI